MSLHLPWTRRDFLRRLAIALPGPLMLTACGGQPQVSAPAVERPRETAAGSEPPTAAQARRVPTPACGDEDDETPAQTEGPFFTPNSPARSSLHEPGMAGTPLVVAGTVLSVDCRPVAGALLDFWHADDAGRYDNVGYRLRGHQFTDSEGRYRLETIRPGQYTGRTRHIHVKVQAPGGPVLTTQLYFPGEPANQRDGLFNPALVMTLDEEGSGLAGRFDFVVEVA